MNKIKKEPWTDTRKFNPIGSGGPRALSMLDPDYVAGLDPDDIYPAETMPDDAVAWCKSYSYNSD